MSASTSELQRTTTLSAPVRGVPRQEQSAASLSQEQSGWNVALEKLQRWSFEPSALFDEDIVAPSPAALEAAVALATEFKNEGLVPPQWVVPSGDGGIVFEHREGVVAEVLEISDDGAAELLRFRGDNLVSRYDIDIA